MAAGPSFLTAGSSWSIPPPPQDRAPRRRPRSLPTRSTGGDSPRSIPLFPTTAAPRSSTTVAATAIGPAGWPTPAAIPAIRGRLSSRGCFKCSATKSAPPGPSAAMPSSCGATPPTTSRSIPTPPTLPTGTAPPPSAPANWRAPRPPGHGSPSTAPTTAKTPGKRPGSRPRTSAPKRRRCRRSTATA